MNPQDRRQNSRQAFEGGEALSLSPAEGERAWVGKQRSKHQLRLHRPCLERVGKFVFGWHKPSARGAGRIGPSRFVRPFWLATSGSPSPLPSPSGRGNTASRAATRRGALDWRKRVERFSLSPGERAGVRGKSRVPVDQIHAQCFDTTPLCPSPLSKGRGNSPPKCGVSCGTASRVGAARWRGREVSSQWTLENRN